MEIQTHYLNLQQLLTDRLFCVPQYQRTYSWEQRQRQDLFDDIKRSYGVEDSVDHFMSTVVALYKGPVMIGGSESECQEVDIVDGQQRVTTLIVLLKAISKALENSDPSQGSLHKRIEKMLVRADHGDRLLLETNHDSSDHFGKYIRTGQYLNFRTAGTMEDRQLLSAMRECEEFVKDWSEEDYPLEDLVVHLFDRLKFVYHQINDERVVYTVFESQNSRGLEATWFDRLKSMLMALVFESSGTGSNSDLIDEVHQIWGDIYRTIGTRVELSHEVLRFAATLHRYPVPTQPIREDREAADQLLREASGSPSDVIRVSKFIRSVTRAVNAMDRDRENRRLNAITRPPQARLVATAIRLRTNIDRERILRRWENVTFRIYGMGGRSTRTARADYTRLAWQIVNQTWSLTTEQILNELQSIGNYYPIDLAVRELRQRNCYESMKGEPLIYFFRRYEEHLASNEGQKLDKKHWRRNWAWENPDDSVEHILPQSSGKGEHVHWLGNLMLLPPRLNTSLSADSPKEKAEHYMKTGLRFAMEVAEQVSNGWTKRDIARRDRALLSWAKREWAD